MRFFGVTAALVLMAAAGVSAAEITQAPLKLIQVTGNREIPAEKIVAASGLTTGKTVTRADFDAARERLQATGAFETVGYEYKFPTGSDGEVTLEVREANPVFAYRFENLPVTDNVLREALRAQEPLCGDRIPVAATARYVDAIVQAGVKLPVTWKVEEVAGAQTIVFQPVITLPMIAEVRFEGNGVLPEEALLRPINSVAVGIPYTDAALRERLDAAIRPLYEARGRIRVAFSKIVAVKAEKIDGVVATVTVSEGPAYKLGEVRFTGEPADDSAQLVRLADLRKGDTANFDDVKAAVAKVEKKYRDKGYLHVSSKVDRDVRDDDKTVNLTVALALGAQYRFGKLSILGLDLLAEPEIRKAWGPMEGTPYQPEYADAFLDRLKAEKVFENPVRAVAGMRIDEAAKTVDTTLTFGGKDNTRSETNPFGDPPPESKFGRE